MDQNINNPIPVPKPPKFQKIESEQITERKGSVPLEDIKNTSPSDLKFQKFLRFVILGIISLFLFFYLSSWLCFNNILCIRLDKIIPNISLEGESFFYFFGFIFLVIIAVFIILWVNLMFNKKAVRRTNILGIIILLPFVIFIFLLIMFLKNFS